ncbi:growth arrest-specific protein 2-like isoform X2 [Halichondria panicea]
MDECDAPTSPEIALKEMEALEAIKEDICQWLTRIMHIAITPSSFMDHLDNGVVLCQLARLTQEAANKSQELPASVPIKCNDKAVSGSFQARDNASNFISWCRDFGVEEAVVFESNGLVDHSDEKRVVLCLLDVARFADRVGISPPELVRMEREIEELDSASPLLTSNGDQRQGHLKQSQLSRKVLAMLSDCKCPPLQGMVVRDCGSGKFIVSGGRIRAHKTLYARLLSDRIMVRVGGGWDTLDHFLLVHDPCRIKQFIL